MIGPAFLLMAIAFNLVAALVWAGAIVGFVNLAVYLGPWFDWPMGIIGLLLMIACFGIANMALMRLAER